MRPMVFISKTGAERFAAKLVGRDGVSFCRVFPRSLIDHDRSRVSGFVVARFDRAGFSLGNVAEEV